MRRRLGDRIEYAYASVKFAFYYVRSRLPVYRAIRDKLREIKPDLVHFNNTVIADTPGIHAARTCGIPTVAHVRNFGDVTYLSVRICKRVKAFICISTAVRDYLVHRGIDKQRCIVIPNAVDLERFSATATMPYTYEATAVDADNDMMLWILDGGPSGMSLDADPARAEADEEERESQG